MIKCVLIGEMDSGAVDGQILYREEQYGSFDDEKGFLYLYDSNRKLKEVINMTSRNFHCVKFIEE
jgi:hypothetical protein